MFLAVTGGIGAGKTTVLRYFSREGALVADADDIAHSLYRPGNSVYDGMVRRWGERILRPDGTLDRPLIASLVFAKQEERQWLEQLVHPLIRREIRAAGEQARAERRHCVCAVPLLYETGWQKEFDAVAAVWCPGNVQWNRLLNRGWSREEIARRLQTQISMDEKLERADFAICSDCSWEVLELQCRSLLEQLASPENG